jgi:hypothetical protein
MMISAVRAVTSTAARYAELNWLDGVPCEQLSDARRACHGYLKPPSGPEIDLVEIASETAAMAR